MKKIKIFPAPHLEVRIHVSDQMEADLKSCRRMLEETGDSGGCKTCGWGDMDFGDMDLCGMREVIEKVLENG